ncbi:catenin alpha-2-like [Dendronephthya gigantea]|uniref:catenin alpha-2-like n=1 Tax=Dendronephthya gigantea TaxID=151771 RepID=UPI00106B65CE|nr:catenin alpha-2-like [Dendronephthya gigantea]
MASQRSATREYRVEHSKVKWDPKTMEIRTHSVEKALEPLVQQVTTLVNRYKSLRKAGKSKTAHQLVREIVAAIDKLIQVGQDIADDFPEIADEMLKACRDTKNAGELMGVDSKTFANDPHSNEKRNDMIKSARALLSAVTRLLCIADMADVYRLLASLKLVEEKLAELERVKDPQALVAAFKSLGVDLMSLAKLSGARQADLKDPRRKEEIAAARAMLKDASKMLLTSSKVYVQHPDIQSAHINRNYVLKQMSEALQTIYGAAQATGKSEPSPFEAPGALSGALDNFDANLVMDPAAFLEKRTQIRIEEQLERILAGARRLSDLPTTRVSTREKLLLECANVRNALHELVAVYVNYAQTKRRQKPGDELDQSIQNMTERTQDLRKQMRVAVADHISDTFLDTLVPLMLLVEAAQDGNQKEVEECAIVFTEGAAKLEEVANLACSVSSNAEGVKLVRVVTKNIHALCPQVINAARTLAARPRSRAARENMDVFKTSWENQVHLLVDAVDEITGVDEFLAVSENHIGEDVETCIQALKQRDVETLDRSAGLIRGRTERVISVVLTEMENFEQGPYTEGVQKTVRSLKEDIIPRFADVVESTVETLSQNPRARIDEERVIQTSQLVYDAIRDVRKAVMLKSKRFADGNVMGVDEIYTAEVRKQQELAVAKEEAAYEQLQAAGKVHYDIRASGGDDIGGMGVASIKVNGVEYCHKRLGHNVVVLDPAGQFVASRNFDTTTQEGGVAMGRFLDDLPEDHIVLIATQETTGAGVEHAGPALERLGAKGPFNPGYRSSWAFAGYTGPDPKPWIREESRSAEQGPTLVSNLIYTPAYEQGKIKIVIRAEGSDDPDKQGHCSIKVNGVERSLKLRGHNLVVLDDSGNFVTSGTFDTGDTSRDEGRAMARFLDGLPNERIVLIATQDTKGVGVNEAKDSLARIGATGNVNPGPGGSWVFMGYTGPDGVDWVTQMARPRHKGPCVVSEFITLPAAAKAIVEEQVRPPSGEVDAYEYEAEPGQESDDEEDLDLSERSDRAKMRALPAEEKAKIERLSTELRSEKSRFENMLSQWDESGNEIVVLAKKMCMMMMDMSDFTRGTGPLKTTMDVINAAKRIARSGARMNQLATEVAEKCPHSQSKNDLLAYIQRISLFSHQLTITSRVKADIQTISGVEVVSALESATSLITSAKNLMNAVILTVKASYVASTKYRGSNRSAINWKMKAPGKKPLISSQPTADPRERVTTKSTRQREQTPLQALSEFDTGTPRKRTDF